MSFFCLIKSLDNVCQFLIICDQEAAEMVVPGFELEGNTGGVCTFFVITKLVPALWAVNVNHGASRRVRSPETKGGNVPMAKLDVMANARPIYLWQKYQHLGITVEDTCFAGAIV